jgi:hypothetical protein
MSNPGKEFPGAKDKLIILLIKMFPYLLGAGVLFRMGFLVAGSFEIKNTGYIFPGFLFILFVLLFLKFDTGWNLALIIIFSVISGFMLGCLDPDCFQNKSVVLFLILSLLTWIGVGFLRRDVSIPLFVMLFLCIGHLLGWIWIVTASQHTRIFFVWIIFGIGLNLLFSLGILNRAKKEISAVEEIPLAVDLIVFSINLFWFSAFLV